MSEAVRASIASVLRGGRLSQEEARNAMGEVMDGLATPAQLAGLLVALRMRTETADELAGFAMAMRARLIPIDAPADAIDTCGTGGDGAGTFNISTAAALVAAAAGLPVAKHGNRAVTSASGSADVLEALGIPIDHGPDTAGEVLAREGFVFLFAPAYHPAMRHAGAVRRELGVPTAFNLLGPLTNPAGVRRQVVGVADPGAAERVAQVLHALGAEKALVVSGDGLDELPLDGSAVAYEISPAGVQRTRVNSAELGLPSASVDALSGGSAAENAAIIEAILSGAETGPRRDVVLLNAAAALLVGGRVENLLDGVDTAAAVIDGGHARSLLGRLRNSRVASTAA